MVTSLPYCIYLPIFRNKWFLLQGFLSICLTGSRCMSEASKQYNTFFYRLPVFNCYVCLGTLKIFTNINVVSIKCIYLVNSQYLLFVLSLGDCLSSFDCPLFYFFKMWVVFKKFAYILH